GSAGIEVALKMSHHYWCNLGRPQKKKFISLSNGYHGETLATLSVSDVPLYNQTYQALLMDCMKVPSPHCYLRELGKSGEQHSREMFVHMQQALEQHAHEAAALRLETRSRGAGGRRMYRRIYLGLLSYACRGACVHLTVDEIAAAFRRPGSMLACKQTGNSPDFRAVS